MPPESGNGRCREASAHWHRDWGRVSGLWQHVPEVPDATFYVSIETSSSEGEDGAHFDTKLRGAALVEVTAAVGTTAARYLPGRLDRREQRRSWKLSELERHIIETAAEVDRKH